MRKILVALLIMFIFLVSCAPQMTDEELEAELAKLTPEEREELVKHLEAKESGALAGQASRDSTQRVQTTFRNKGVSTKVSYLPVSQVKKVISKTVIADKGVAKAITPEGKAAQFCNQLAPTSSTSEKKYLNLDKKTHYCSQSGNEIKYDRFRCASDPKGPKTVHEIDTSNNRNILYDTADTCKEILAQFLDKPEYEYVGCEVTGQDIYGNSVRDFYQLQTGNKAPSASSASAHPISEVGTCTGITVESYLCADSDGGLNYGVKGTTEDVDDLVSDECVSPTTLREKYCEDGTVKFKEIDCKEEVEGPQASSYMCNNGACKYACIDSDGGTDIFKKGIVSGTVITTEGPKYTTREDVCGALSKVGIVEKCNSQEDTCVLAEYHCDSAGYVGTYSSSVICEYGCKDGACLPPPPTASKT